MITLYNEMTRLMEGIIDMAMWWVTFLSLLSVKLHHNRHVSRSLSPLLEVYTLQISVHHPSWRNLSMLPELSR